MSTTANRTRGAVPTRMAAAIAALSLLAMPVPAGAQGSGRTVLLTLTEGASLSQLADTVGALGGRVLATLELSDSLLVELPTGVGAPAGSAEIPDTPMKVNGTRTTDAAQRAHVPRDDRARRRARSVGTGVTVALVDTGVADAAGSRTSCTCTSTASSARTRRRPRTRHLPRRHHRRDVGTSSRASHPARRCSTSRLPTTRAPPRCRKVLAGLEKRSRPGDEVDVVNISLSTGSPLPPSFDPLARALERLWAGGVTVVTAAGNDGPDTDSVASPGNDPVLLTVGALDEEGHARREQRRGGGVQLSRGPSTPSPSPTWWRRACPLISTAAPDSIALHATTLSRTSAMAVHARLRNLDVRGRGLGRGRRGPGRPTPTSDTRTV